MAESQVFRMNRRAFLGSLFAAPLAAAVALAPSPNILIAAPFEVTFPMTFGSGALAMSEAEFSRRYLAPAVDALADAIDQAAFARMVGR